MNSGSNLPALVNKIMKGQFAPIRGSYSPLFKQLVRDLLQRDPEFRPSAAEILLSKVPALHVQYESHYYDELEGVEEELVTGANSKPKTGRPVRSILYYLKGYESSVSLVPVPLPPRSRIQQVAVSNTHLVVLTAEGLVFTWGEGKKGQLGHGELEAWRSRPLCVEALKGKSITRVGAGDGFSVFSSDNGIVMTCGDGSFGALGHGDWNSSARPLLIEQLLSVDVVDVGCGAEHVVVVGGRGDVYSWGRGQAGRLGLNSEEDQCSPREVELDTEEIYITNVECGTDGTMFISHEGHLYACGSNQHNKLGLNDQRGWILSGEMKQALVPTRVKSVKQKIISVSLGTDHTACLSEDGHMTTFGRNSAGQLGRGHARAGTSSMPGSVRGMSGRVVSMAECGATFTVCATLDNVLHFWGTRNISPVTRPSTQDAFGANFVTRINTPEEETNKEHSEDDVFSESAMKRHQAAITLRDVVLEPQEILALYSSDAQLERGHTVMLHSLKCHNQNIFLTVETTCPLHRVHKHHLQTDRREEQVLDMKDEEDEEEDNLNTTNSSKDTKEGEMERSVLPDWLEAELKEAETDQRQNRKKKKKKNRKQSKERQGHGHHPHSVHSEEEERGELTESQMERVKRMEREYERRQQEIMLEAEEAVRAREEALNQELHRLREELERQRSLQTDYIQDKMGGRRQEEDRHSSSSCSLQ